MPCGLIMSELSGVIRHLFWKGFPSSIYFFFPPQETCLQEETPKAKQDLSPIRIKVVGALNRMHPSPSNIHLNVCIYLYINMFILSSSLFTFSVSVGWILFFKFLSEHVRANFFIPRVISTQWFVCKRDIRMLKGRFLPYITWTLVIWAESGDDALRHLHNPQTASRQRN